MSEPTASAPAGRRMVIALGGLLVGMVAGGAAGVLLSRDGDRVTAPPPATASVSAPADEMARHLADVDDAQAALGPGVTRVGARPTVTISDGERQFLVATEAATTSLVAGRYSLVVHCAGRGTLWAAIRVGGEARFGEVSCADRPQRTVIDLVLPAALTDVQQVVTVVPVGDATAAFAFTLLRNQ